MRLVYAWLLGLLAAVVVLIGLFVFFTAAGIRWADAEAQLYSRGERVSLSLSDFRLRRCTCLDLKPELYRKTTEGWVRVNDSLGYRPVNFTAGNNPFYMRAPGMCDVIQCSFEQPLRTSEWQWDGYLYERVTIDGPREELPLWLRQVEPPERIDAYERILAPAGTYRLEFGSAEETFRIG